MLNKVVFLDRDGTINRDSPEYIKSWAEFNFLPGSLAALADMTRSGCHLILITNQSGIHRGMVSMAVLDDMHARLRRAVEATGGRIDDIFFCPHRPDENCDCRKPKPGLIHQARIRHGIDLAQSVMIGDSARDILCGRNAGCGVNILVRTGNGAAAEQALSRQRIKPDAIAADLLDAARIVLSGTLLPVKEK